VDSEFRTGEILQALLPPGEHWKNLQAR